MRFLILNWRDWTHPRAGGAEKDVREFSRRAIADGHEVDLFCGGYSGSEPLVELEGCRIRRFGNSLTVYGAVVPEITKGVRQGRWDVIIDDVNGFPWFTPVYLSRPVVTIFHHPVGRTFFQELPFPLSLAGWGVERLVPFLYRATVITVRSNRIGDYLVTHGADPRRIRVVPSGVDHSRFRPSAAKSPTPKLLFVGPVKPYKHPEIALAVLARVLGQFPDAELVVLGRSTHDVERSVLRTATALGLTQHVNVRGFVSDAEKTRIMSESWLLLVPSEREGWSLAAIEANACGTPVVAFDVGGMVDSVSVGRSGLLIPWGNITEFAQAVIRLVSDKDLRTQLSASSIEWARQFSWERYYTDMLDAVRLAMRE